MFPQSDLYLYTCTLWMNKQEGFYVTFNECISWGGGGDLNERKVSVRYEVGLVLGIVPKITQYWWFLIIY